MWIFAYGSLIFRPDFPFVERRRAFVTGWARRFWQGSPDHRGVPEAPGRVVTLVPAETELCGGAAYRIAPEHAEEVTAALDAREQAGFVRRWLPLRAAGGDAPFAQALTYVADLANPHFLGALPEVEIAAWIAARKGPSGTNRDYVLLLDAALRALEVADPHVEEIARLLAVPG